MKGERQKRDICKGGEAHFFSTSGARYPSHIYVYEIKGSRLPRDVPPQGLEGVWPEPPFYYLFYRDDSVAGPVLEWLKSHPDWRLTARYDLPFQSWQDVSVPLISIGLFDIWLSAAPENNPARIPIFIDPGVVFGSGLHPATKGCLLAISEIFQDNVIHTAIDFGTGTGVLAIACALAGAEFVPAVDRNPLALKVAGRNIRANGVQDRIALAEADRPGCLDIRSDLLIMNLEWPILENILSAGAWRNSRRVVLAGFLESRLESVNRFARPQFDVDNVIECGGWPTVVLRAVKSEE